MASKDVLSHLPSLDVRGVKIFTTPTQPSSIPSSLEAIKLGSVLYSLSGSTSVTFSLKDGLATKLIARSRKDFEVDFAAGREADLSRLLLGLEGGGTEAGAENEASS